MSLEKKYNLKSPGVKRLMREACELADPTDEYFARPLEDNLFEWHFTVRGPPNTEFEGGFYHGRIILPFQYPMQPPNIILLTPNGRFEVNKKICLSISGHHPESWQPSWSIRTALLALIAFMPTAAAGTIGSLDYTKEERQTLARKSKNWECSVCGRISEHLSSHAGSELTQEESSLIQQIALKAEEDTNRKDVNKKETEPAAQTENDSSAEQPGEGAVRHRNIGENVHTSNAPINHSVTVNTNTCLMDKVFNIIISIMVSVIVVLIVRRLFFMN